MTPTIFPLTSSVCPLVKKGSSWRMTVDYHKSIQLWTPIAAAILDVALLLPGMQLFSYPTHEHFYLYVLKKENCKEQFPFSRASSTHSLNHVRTVPMLQL